MRDQRAIWESIYGGRASQRGSEASDFAAEVAALLSPASRVLELGCGTGGDALYFAALGHQVTAIDHSQTVIDRAIATLAGLTGVSFEVADFTPPLSQTDGAFDAVYARLSLHYFGDAVTKALFREIHRVLAPGGLLAFVCRSTADGRYGQGVEIEANVFDADHLRHFFSLEYTAECLDPDFERLALSEVRGPLYGSESVYVKALARRR
jgi:SAM-dependent methyltransferase